MIKNTPNQKCLSLYFLVILLFFFYSDSTSVQEIIAELNKPSNQQNPSIQTIDNIKDQINKSQTKQEQLNSIFQNLNFLLTTYFDNCSIVDKQSNLMENCSIQKKKFSQFLYDLFHRQILRGYLIYQTNKNLQEFKSKEEQIKKLAIEAYNQWIQIYFPNQRIQVQEFYYIMNSIQESVLEIIQHNEKFDVLALVMKEVLNITLTPKQHLNQGNKSNQQIQTDIAMLYAQNFDNQCQFAKNCDMPLNRFTHFVKQMSYYMIPVKQEWKRENGKVLISPDLDYQVSKFLTNQMKAYSDILGQKVDYQQIKQYTFLLTQKLFQHLISEHQRQKQKHKSQFSQNNPQNMQGHSQNKLEINEADLKQQNIENEHKIDAQL